MSREIANGAIFIADSHYPHHGDTFLKILQQIEKKDINPTQLFLMGDIFDLLFGYNQYIQTFSKPAIDLLQKLSLDLEIIYIEGNHDFCLKDIFPKIKVYSRKEQPVEYLLGEDKIYLSHGDRYATGSLYSLYSNILRNKTTLTLLKPFEKQIIDHRMKKLKAKKICKEFKNHKKKFDTIISHYPKESIIIEGHFHQGLIHKNYISLPSLACQGKITLVEDGELKFYTPTVQP